MLYELTSDNIIALVRAVGYINREQLLRFFSDATDPSVTDYYIDQLCKTRMFDYDENKNIVSWHMACPISDNEIKRRVRALWVVASFKSKNIRDITLLSYPLQFMFVTHEEDVYDLAVLSSKEEAAVAQRKLRGLRIEGVEDDINHIAIVDTETLGKSLGNYGFDSYCVLDRSYKPKYGTWN